MKKETKAFGKRAFLNLDNKPSSALISTLTELKNHIEDEINNNDFRVSQ